MEIFAAMLWFALVTTAVVFALPRVLDALLYYFDQRSKQINDVVAMQERKLEVMKQQYALQERKR